MVRITELIGRPHTFTLKDGNTFRIFARKTKDISESKISDEMRRAEVKGLILITAIAEEEEVSKTSNKKSGGTK